MARAKCKHCNSIVLSPEGSGRWVACSCFRDTEKSRGFYIDDLGYGCIGAGGNLDDIEWLTEDFDVNDEDGVDAGISSKGE